MAILDRIKFDGLLNNKDWLIYRYPGENFVLGSALIVGEGQAVIFTNGGKICDIFYPGSYVLSSYNLPLIKSVVNLPFGGKTPFPAEIYYINTTTKLDLYWGTTDPIQLIDPKYYVRLNIRAFGQFGFKIDNAKLFLQELVGSMGSSVVSYDKVINFYKGILVTKIKVIISDFIINQKVSAFDISAKLDVLSNIALEQLEGEFERYGLKIVNFYIQSVNFPKEDFQQINKILEEKAAFEIIGDDRYITKRSFDVYEGAANNSSGLTGAFVGGGIGIGLGVSAAQNIQKDTVAAHHTEVKCPKCMALNPNNSKFCSSCGEVLIKETKKCTACNKDIPVNAKFCNYCGALQQLERKCECGNILPAGSKFCSNCGKKMED